MQHFFFLSFLFFLQQRYTKNVFLVKTCLACCIVMGEKSTTSFNCEGSKWQLCNPHDFYEQSDIFKRQQKKQQILISRFYFLKNLNQHSEMRWGKRFPFLLP